MEDQTIVNNDLKPITDKVFSVQAGNTEDEFFSFELPQIVDSSLLIFNPFRKGIITEKVVNQVVEEYYRDNLNNSEKLSFPLMHGVLLKEYLIEDITWLGRNKDEADKFIKDKIIVKYQQILPQIMEKMNIMENKLKTTQIRKQQSGDDLLEL